MISCITLTLVFGDTNFGLTDSLQCNIRSVHLVTISSEVFEISVHRILRVLLLLLLLLLRFLCHVFTSSQSQICLSVRFGFVHCFYLCMYVCMYLAYMHVCMYACMHVCMYACMHVCMYACMHV